MRLLRATEEKMIPLPIRSSVLGSAIHSLPRKKLNNCLRLPSQNHTWKSAFLMRIQCPISSSHPLDLLLGVQHTDLHQCLPSLSAVLTRLLLSA